MQKYYVVKSLMLANSLMFITGQKPYTFDNRDNSNKKVWSFVNTVELEEALKLLMELRNRINIKH